MRNNTPPASKADAQGHCIKCCTKVKNFSLLTMNFASIRC